MKMAPNKTLHLKPELTLFKNRMAYSYINRDLATENENFVGQITIRGHKLELSQFETKLNVTHFDVIINPRHTFIPFNSFE